MPSGPSRRQNRPPPTGLSTHIDEIYPWQYWPTPQERSLRAITEPVLMDSYIVNWNPQTQEFDRTPQPPQYSRRYTPSFPRTSTSNGKKLGFKAFVSHHLPLPKQKQTNSQTTVSDSSHAPFTIGEVLAGTGWTARELGTVLATYRQSSLRDSSFESSLSWVDPSSLFESE